VRFAVAAAVALAALAGVITLVVVIRAHESTTGKLDFASTRAAATPFDQFREARVTVGSRCLRVLVALTAAQRSQGLRGVRALAPYDGMLFVNRADTTERFTMAQTPMPLDITFFSSRGAPVDHARMTPCPVGTDATCPTYESRSAYRYALEQPQGASPAAGSGALGPCAA
jgi:uncharacterized membrane protein (UPF0127 family)